MDKGFNFNVKKNIKIKSYIGKFFRVIAAIILKCGRYLFYLHFI